MIVGKVAMAYLLGGLVRKIWNDKITTNKLKSTKKTCSNGRFSFYLLNLSRYLARQRYLVHYIYFAFEKLFHMWVGL